MVVFKFYNNFIICEQCVCVCVSVHVIDCKWIETERERDGESRGKLEQEHYYTRNHMNQLITDVFNVNLYNTT